MIELFLVCTLVYFALASVAYIFARKRRAIFWSDFVLPIVVVFGWVAITASGYGHQSLSHVIEVPIALLFALVVFNLRVFVIDRYIADYRKSSYAALALSVFFVFILRTFMPFLPE